MRRVEAKSRYSARLEGMRSIACCIKVRPLEMAADLRGRRTSWQNIANHAQRHSYCGHRKRSDCGQGSNAKQEGPCSTAVVERRSAPSEGHGAQGAALED